MNKKINNLKIKNSKVLKNKTKISLQYQEYEKQQLQTLEIENTWDNTKTPYFHCGPSLKKYK